MSRPSRAGSGTAPGPRHGLHIVSGKGGTGKTTIAGALACALATNGRRVLLCEVEGRGGIAELFGAPALVGAEERRLVRTPSGGHVHGLSIDAEDALLEYLETFYHLGLAGRALDRFGAIDFATSIAPGLRDVLLTGKVYEAVRRGPTGRPGAYDAVVLDAPPTGRISQFLNVHEAVSGLARMGPIRNQADSIMTVLRSATTVVHFVTMLEDMPVTETEEAVVALAPTRITVGAVIENMVNPTPLDADELQQAAAGTLPVAVPGWSDAQNDALAAEFAVDAARTLQQQERHARLTGLALPLAAVPFDPAGIDEAALFSIADQLRAQIGLEAALMARQPKRPKVVVDPTPFLELDAVIADRETEIVICCGSGGVGKTTTSAALALRAAEAGRKVVVLTIDPARRLAQSLGLGELDNTPRPVLGVDTAAGGSLDAMMLDMKRTFDDVVMARSTPERAQEILSNPFYEALSSSFSGTQEYMAMEKLGQLHEQSVTEGRSAADARWDLIVVDTPPSRSALDFLDAPEHLSSLLDGRFLRLLLAPARGPLRLMSVGFTLVSSAMNKILGTQIIRDLQTFVAAFEALFGGFRARADVTYRLLSSRHTTFVVVATPQRDALREAAYFVDRLTEEQMPLSGLVVNRIHTSGLGVSADRARSLAEDLPDEARIEVEALRRHADLMRVVEAEQQLLTRFSGSRPQVARTLVETLPTDVTDLDSLRQVGALLAKQD